MKPTAVVGTLLLFFLLIIALFAALLFLWQEREATLTLAATVEPQAIAAEATLVQVMAEQRESRATATAVSLSEQAAQATREAELDELQAQVEQLQQSLTAVAEAPADPPPIAEGTPPPEQPQVRLFIADRLATRRVNEPVTIVASAAHPDGITVLNISVDGEPLIVDSPADVNLHTTTVEWLPTAEGEYRLTALATTSRGRASEPVALNLTVVGAEADLNSALREQIQQNVLELRELSLLSPVTAELVSPAQVQSRLEADFYAETTLAEARRNVLVLRGFDFVPRGFNVDTLEAPNFAAVVAGYYDTDTQELFVVTAEGEEIMSQPAQLTFAHEFMHALQDQHFRLGELDLDNVNISKDIRLAWRALGEGEAELVEYLYSARGYLTGEELDEAEQIYGTPEFGNLPDFLVGEFNFPYARGFDFVYELYQTGGFPAVNAAWENLPTSTEQILHPEKYLAGDAPQTLSLPDLSTTLGASWLLVEENRLGEFYLREHLLLQLPRPEATEAAAGWGGDRYALYHQPATDDIVLLAKLVWDTAVDQTEFVSAYQTYAAQVTGADATAVDETTTCWGNDIEQICLRNEGDETFLWRVPDAETATAVLNDLPRP